VNVIVLIGRHGCHWVWGIGQTPAYVCSCKQGRGRVKNPEPWSGWKMAIDVLSSRLDRSEAGYVMVGHWHNDRCLCHSPMIYLIARGHDTTSEGGLWQCTTSRCGRTSELLVQGPGPREKFVTYATAIAIRIYGSKLT
jgi:hypothetical protein